MAACIHCGKETGLPNTGTCNLCQIVIQHLPDFLVSHEGQHLVANALEVQRSKEFKQALDIKVAKFDDYSIEELEAMITHKQRQKSQLVGTLYPGILDDEIKIIGLAVSRKRAQRTDDTQTSPEAGLH